MQRGGKDGRVRQFRSVDAVAACSTSAAGSGALSIVVFDWAEEQSLQPQTEAARCGRRLLTGAQPSDDPICETPAAALDRRM
ncbi:hypothetical protein CWO89_43950 [Bradyrhizobium sp. Leo170]|nr:hypothetical protein CWO90_47135 [Bradyrhizobium sp. Leo121]TAI59850.1 hypothetical protein CWO89_43950 [Bradyrhizobium sp. Leo170]